MSPFSTIKGPFGKATVRALRFGRIYVLEESVYRNLPGTLPLDMPDLLQYAISQERNVGVFPIHEYWMDLGSPEELMLARDADKKKMESGGKGKSPE